MSKYIGMENKNGKAVLISPAKHSLTFNGARNTKFGVTNMTLEQFRAEIKRQAVGLLSGAAKFQVKMSIAYGLIIPQFDKKVVFYFEKVKRKD